MGPPPLAAHHRCRRQVINSNDIPWHSTELSSKGYAKMKYRTLPLIIMLACFSYAGVGDAVSAPFQNFANERKISLSGD
jgi:hypothetical protein